MLGSGAAVATAFVGTPGTGAAPVTNNPDLVSVTLLADNAYGTRERANFCFDEQLRDSSVTAADGANFFVKTYDADRFDSGSNAVLSSSDGKCVTVTFNPNTDLTLLGSIGEVNAGTVEDLGGDTNYFSNAPLTGSTLKQEPGKTTGPDLISAVGDESNDTVRFTFDQPVDPAAITPANFQVVAANGDAVATGVVPATADVATQREVTVTFDEAAQVESATKYAVLRGAVRTRPQTGNNAGPPTTNFTLAPDAVFSKSTSTRPELQSAASRTDGSAQFALTYSSDTNLDNATVGGIIAVFDNGEIEGATSVTRVTGSTRQFVVSFPAGGLVDDEPGAVVRIVSRNGAARTTSDQAAPVSAANIGGGAASTPGITNAPDLLTTTIDTTTSQAVFNFDEPVDRTAVGAAGQFVLLIPNGNPVTGTSIAGVSSNGRQVFVQFGGDVAAAVGVGLAQGAVVDESGNPSPYASVSTTNVALPPTGSVPTPPVTTPPVTTPPSTTPPVVKRSKFRTSFSSFKVKSRTRYSGRIASSGRGCKSGRRIALKRNGRTIRNGFTKGDGTFSIARTSGTRRKSGIYVVVTERTTSTTTCTARSSKKIRG